MKITIHGCKFSTPKRPETKQGRMTRLYARLHEDHLLSKLEMLTSQIVELSNRLSRIEARRRSIKARSKGGR